MSKLLRLSDEERILHDLCRLHGVGRDDTVKPGRNLYDLLGFPLSIEVSPRATHETLIHVYQAARMAIIHRSPVAEAREFLDTLDLIWHTLGDPARRKKYDELLTGGFPLNKVPELG